MKNSWTLTVRILKGKYLFQLFNIHENTKETLRYLTQTSLVPKHENRRSEFSLKKYIPRAQLLTFLLLLTISGLYADFITASSVLLCAWDPFLSGYLRFRICSVKNMKANTPGPG